MLGAPIIPGEDSMNSGGGAAGSIGIPCNDISPAVTKVAATTELVLLRRSIPVLLIEFAATEQFGMSSWVEAAISTSVLFVPSAKMHGLSSASITATAVLAMVTPDKNIAASKAPWDCCSVTATPLVTIPSLKRVTTAGTFPL